MKPRKPLPRATKPLKRTPLPRPTKPISRSKYRPQVRVGKLGIVRLRGKALKKLRQELFERDRHRCVDCGSWVAWDEYDAEMLGVPIGEMCHIKSRGAGGSDTLDNVVLRCRRDHKYSHNCGGRPLPRKPQ